MTAEGLALYSAVNNGGTSLTQEIRDNALKLFEGVEDPDQFDPIYGNSGVAGGIITITHFWNPDADIDAPMEFNFPILGEDDYPNAFGAAQASWSRALGEYAAGNKPEAFRYLGMVAHFLGDQTIPTHVHGDTHGPDALDYDAFEEWMSVPGAGNPPLFTGPRPTQAATSRAYLTQDEANALRMPQMGILDPSDFATEINDQLLWIFLNTNQVADFFASDGGGFGMTGSAVNGDAVHPSDPDYPFISGWAQNAINKVTSDCAGEPGGCPTVSSDLVDNHGGDVDGVNDGDGDLSLIRKHSYLNGVRAMGALFKLWEEAITTPILNVTVERIVEVGDDVLGGVIGLDGVFDPDFYVGIVTGYNQRLRSNIPAGAYLHDRDRNPRIIDGEQMAANVTRRDAFRDEDEGGTEDQTLVTPFYHFGQANRFLAGNAYVPGVDLVNISLAVWDQDSSLDPSTDPYSVDQLGDINPEAGRILNISVDLAKCASGGFAPVTIGSSQHSCGLTIIKFPDDDEASDVQVNFKIELIVLNRPPTAEAGGPYTVPEGGSVQLTGAASHDPEQAANTLTYEWDLDNNGSFETTGINPTFSAAGLDGPSNRKVVLRVTDNGGLWDTDDATIEITNVDPDLQHVAVSAEVNENGIATLSGNIVDPGVPDTFTLVVDWGEDAPQTYNYPAGTTSFSVTHQYLDDNPTGTPQDFYKIKLSLTDDDGGTDSADVPTLVKNLNPVVTTFKSDAVECGDKAAGETVHVVGAFTDVGTKDTHKATISWGDGALTDATIVEAGGAGSIAGHHIYASGGIFRIVVTLTDDDTGQTTARTFALLTGVGILDGQLMAVGTKKADDINVNRTGSDQFVVHASFVPDSPRTLPATGVTSIAMFLCEGDDRASIASSIALPTFIAAEEGHDELNGGGGPNILLGGDGNDRLAGGSGHDILVGGDGADRIVASGGDDILIAGTLASEADPIDQLDALLALLIDWNEDRDRERLRSKLVIGGDDDIDKLTGSSGADWYFFDFGEDTAPDQKNELAEDVG